MSQDIQGWFLHTCIALHLLLGFLGMDSWTLLTTNIISVRDREFSAVGYKLGSDDYIDANIRLAISAATSVSFRHEFSSTLRLQTSNHYVKRSAPVSCNLVDPYSVKTDCRRVDLADLNANPVLLSCDFGFLVMAAWWGLGNAIDKLNRS